MNKSFFLKNPFIIATRQSPLALKQAELVKKRLLQHYPSLIIEYLALTTEADKQAKKDISMMGGKGVFVKELEESLLTRKATIAVHSMKDVPMNLPDGLRIAAIPPREDPRDVFISNDYATWQDLPAGAIIGTSSLRRQTQLQHLRKNLIFKNIRGNIHTRLQRLDHKEVDALILAGAGLIRLGLQNRIRHFFPITEILPACGQGTLCIECSAEDTETQTLVAKLNDPLANLCAKAERAFCHRLEGGCQVPVAAFATIEDKTLCLRGLVAGPEGKELLRTERKGSAYDAKNIGFKAAEDLLSQGAATLLKYYTS